MIILGWVLVVLGISGTIGAVTMEIIAQEPIYFLMMKLTSGIFGTGGILLAMKALKK